MTAALVNVLIGLVTSVVSGGSVWLWQRGSKSRLRRRKAAFFGIGRGGECLIMMNNKFDRPGTVAQHDVHALIEVATLVEELGSRIEVTKGAEFQGRNGDRTEFCIGGPTSNPRTAGHLAAALPGVEFLPYGADEDPMAIAVGGDRFPYQRLEREHALIAKFTPQDCARPVIVISGQTSTTNRAAIVFLKRAYRELANTLASTERFCIVVRVDSIATYGHEAASLAADVTEAAFRPTAPPPPRPPEHRSRPEPDPEPQPQPVTPSERTAES